MKLLRPIIVNPALVILAIAMWFFFPQLRVASYEIILRLGAEQRADSEDLRLWAVRRLAEEGLPAAPVLLRGLTREPVPRPPQHSPPHTPYYDALRALQGMGPALVPMLQSALSDDHPLIRIHAAQLLGDLRSAATAAVPALTELLNDEVALVRLAATYALEKIQAHSSGGS